MSPWRRLWPLLALAGCSTTGEDAGAAMQAALESNRASIGAVSPGLARPSPPPATPAPMPAEPVAVPIAAPPLNPPPPGSVPESAAALIGADAEALLRLLGPPRLRRSEGTSEIWLYAGPDCHLDLVLYAEAEGPRVAHAQARADGATPRTESECLAGIARRGA